MKTHIEMLELLMDTENMMYSLQEDTERRLNDIRKAMRPDAFGGVDNDYIEDLSAQNDIDALTYLYMNSIGHEIKDMLDHIRILSEVIRGDISHATFNRRYEQLTFGDA